MWEGAGYRMLSKGRAGENDQVSAQWNVRSRSLETVLEDVKCTAYNRYLWLVLPFAGFTAFDCLEWSSASCGKPRQILLDLRRNLPQGKDLPLTPNTEKKSQVPWQQFVTQFNGLSIVITFLACSLFFSGEDEGLSTLLYPIFGPDIRTMLGSARYVSAHAVSPIKWES